MLRLISFHLMVAAAVGTPASPDARTFPLTRYNEISLDDVVGFAGHLHSVQVGLKAQSNVELSKYDAGFLKNLTDASEIGHKVAGKVLSKLKVEMKPEVCVPIAFRMALGAGDLTLGALCRSWVPRVDPSDYVYGIRIERTGFDLYTVYSWWVAGSQRICLDPKSIFVQI